MWRVVKEDIKDNPDKTSYTTHTHRQNCTNYFFLIFSSSVVRWLKSFDFPSLYCFNQLIMPRRKQDCPKRMKCKYKLIYFVFIFSLSPLLFILVYFRNILRYMSLGLSLLACDWHMSGERNLNFSATDGHFLRHSFVFFPSLSLSSHLPFLFTSLSLLK